jgi:hypothetical protein
VPPSNSFLRPPLLPPDDSPIRRTSMARRPQRRPDRRQPPTGGRGTLIGSHKRRGMSGLGLLLIHRINLIKKKSNRTFIYEQRETAKLKRFLFVYLRVPYHVYHAITKEVIEVSVDLKFISVLAYIYMHRDVHAICFSHRAGFEGPCGMYYDTAMTCHSAVSTLLIPTPAVGDSNRCKIVTLGDSVLLPAHLISQASKGCIKRTNTSCRRTHRSSQNKYYY